MDHLKLNLQTGCETTRKNTLTLISQLVEKYAKDQKKADNINLYRHKLPLDEETKLETMGAVADMAKERGINEGALPCVEEVVQDAVVVYPLMRQATKRCLVKPS